MKVKYSRPIKFKAAINIIRPHNYGFNINFNFPILINYNIPIEILNKESVIISPDSFEKNYLFGINIGVEKISKSFIGSFSFTNINKELYKDRTFFVKENIFKIIEKYKIVINDGKLFYKINIEDTLENLDIFLDYIEKNKITDIRVISTLDVRQIFGG